MNKLNKFISEFLFNFRIGKKEVKHIYLDEESIKKHHEIRALAIELAETKGERDKLKSIVSEYDENKKNLQSEENIKAKVIKDKQRIDAKKKVDYLSLNSLLNRISRGMITATTWNKDKMLEKVTKIGLTMRGDMIIFGEGEKPLIIGQPKDIFFNPPGLTIETELGLLPLAINERGDWMENIMELETPEYITTSSGKLKLKTASTKPNYEIMRKKDKEKNYWKIKAEESELLNEEYLSRLEKIESEFKIVREGSKNARANYNESNESLTEILKAFYPSEKELLTLRNQSSAQEEDLDSQDKIIEDLREQVEREMVKSSDKTALEKLMNIRRTLADEKQDEREIEASKPVVTATPPQTK